MPRHLPKQSGATATCLLTTGGSCRLCFQEAALKHALSFPAVERAVYSTCSVHRRENEDVVANVLTTVTEMGWHVEPALPTWPRRGMAGTALSDAEGEMRLSPLAPLCRRAWTQWG